MDIVHLKTRLTEIVKKNKKSVIVLCGALFFLLLLFVTDTQKTEENTLSENDLLRLLENETEKKLESFLQNVDGVGRVKVYLTFDSLTQSDYAKDLRKEQNGDKTDLDYEYVIIENQQGYDSGLCIMSTAPKIRGVAVCCDGGNSVKVQTEITLLLSASLNIPTNRIHISAYKQSN